MKNRWSDRDAEQFIAQYGAQWGADLALRTYTTRLLGSEEALVLHGGGNTSLKGTHRNVFGAGNSRALHEGFRVQSGHDRTRRAHAARPRVSEAAVRASRAFR